MSEVQETNGYASATDLAELSKRRYRDVFVGGKTFRIQSLTELERMELESHLLNKKGNSVDTAEFKLSRARLIAKCLVDGEGRRLFADAQVMEIAHLDGGIIDLLHEACEEHCLPKDIEELAKN